MTSLESSDFWRGVFTPLRKHRHHPKTRHPSHFPDHVIVEWVAMLTDDEIESYNEDSENDYGYDELTELGDGEIPYLARVRFAGESGSKYDYIINATADATEEEVKEIAHELVVSDLTPY